MTRIFVTGGAGFIGANVVARLMAAGEHDVLTVDKLTYAGNRASLAAVMPHPRHRLLVADIGDADAMRAAFEGFGPELLLNLAAESHVDRSISGPTTFIATNVAGTGVLLAEAQRYWERLAEDRRRGFRFVQVSTDEVFGALGESGRFDAHSPYQPNSPYSASKAGGDHLARAWHRTYGLPTILTHCSNNYGPFQFPEKLIAQSIVFAREGRAIPVYGQGLNVREWIFVSDHVEGLIAAGFRGEPGGRYLFGGTAERANIEIVRALCRLMDERRPRPAGSHAALITLVADRPGHDFRYAIDDRATRAALDWAPRVDIETGLARTVDWYLAHEDWWRPLLARRDVEAGRPSGGT